jgi:hypothetical protein
MSSSGALVARRGATLVLVASYLNAWQLDFVSVGGRKNVAGDFFELKEVSDGA